MNTTSCLRVHLSPASAVPQTIPLGFMQATRRNRADSAGASSSSDAMILSAVLFDVEIELFEFFAAVLALIAASRARASTYRRVRDSTSAKVPLTGAASPQSS